MKYLEIKGKNSLKGVVEIDGAKNIAVAIIPATILVKGEVTIKNVPNIKDVELLLNILEEMGASVKRDKKTVKIDTTNVVNKKVLYENVKKLRGSYYFMGSFIGRFGEIETHYPGGCNIGQRPIDYHLNAFEESGCSVDLTETIKIKKITHENNPLTCYESVGTTINVLFSLFNTKKVVEILRPSLEIEVLEVIEYLKLIGMQIIIKNNKIVITPNSKENKSVVFPLLFDRMEALTYSVIGGLMGELEIKGVEWGYMENPLNKMINMGCKIKKIKDNSFVIKRSILKGDLIVKTAVYPGFPTDLQQQFTTLLTQGMEPSVIIEEIFENRTSHINELKKMGANIKVLENVFIIEKSNLVGKEVQGKDLRGTAGLLIAGLIADGVTKLTGLEHLERGYSDIYNKLKAIGADIQLKYN